MSVRLSQEQQKSDPRGELLSLLLARRWIEDAKLVEANSQYSRHTSKIILKRVQDSL